MLVMSSRSTLLVLGLHLRFKRQPLADDVFYEHLQVPLHEGVRVDLHDRVLQQRLGAHQLVARGVVDHVQDPHLLGDVLGAPGVVSRVQPQRPVLPRS